METPIVFECHHDRLMGMVHQSDTPKSIGVLIVVGGPQYRVGSHRQFILLARVLAANGYPVMRFDYRGMGDSEGESRSFADVDDDICAAVDAFYLHCKALQNVVIWGLCDAASAALFYAYQDKRVKGLVLLNPWIYTEQGAAKTYLKHYYLQRLLSRDFWIKVIRGRFNVYASLAGLLGLFVKIFAKVKEHSLDSDQSALADVDSNLPLPIRMRECWKRFKFPVLLILSGRDLTADEFRETIQHDATWNELLDAQWVTRHDFADADHTFSSQALRNRVELATLKWLNSLA